MIRYSKIFQVSIFLIVVLLFGIFLYYFNVSNPVTYNKQNRKSYIRYEKAEVVSVKNNSLTQFKQSKNIYFGTQEAQIKILSGEHKDEVKKVTNYLSDTHNVYLKPNMKIIVDISTANGGTYGVTVYNYYRASIQYIFIFIFFAAICIIGGKKGFRSVLGLVFTLTCIIFLFIPLLYRGILRF